MKLKSINALMAALAVTALSLLGLAPTAHADDETVAGSLDQAVITKLVTVPRGEVPDAEQLTFTFTQDTTVTDSTTTTVALTPNMVTGNVTETLTKLDDSAVANLSLGNWDVYRLDVPFGSLISDTTFPHGGMYAYTVKETAGSSLTTTYSKAEYTLRVYVVNGDNGPEVKTITVETSKDQTGADVTSKTKVDSVPNDHTGTGTTTPPTAGTNLDTNDPGSGFRFINGNNTAGDSLKRSLTISKTVTTDGELDAADRTKQFTFELTLTTPVTTQPVQTFLGMINTEGGLAADAREVTFTAGQVQTFTLKHGETLTFANNLPAGTTYALTETGEERYQAEASYQTQENGKDEKSSSVEQQDAGDDLTVAWAKSGDNAIVGSGANNSVEVTNTMTEVSITGIVIDNLPFVLMMLIPVGAAIAFLVVRRRRA